MLLSQLEDKSVELLCYQHKILLSSFLQYRGKLVFGDQHGRSCDLMNLIQVLLEKAIISYSLRQCAFKTFAKYFDSPVFPNGIFPLHFAQSTKLCEKLFDCRELQWTSLKFIDKLFSTELAKCHQIIPCEQTDQSKCLMYRHILKTVVKVFSEKNSLLCFTVYLQSAT